MGYTAYSNVAMGMSDQREAKQALGTIGASDYLYENTYNVPVKLGDESGISTIEDGGSLNGVKSLTLGAQNDYASYLVNFKESGRYGLEPVSYTHLDGARRPDYLLVYRYLERLFCARNLFEKL